MLPIEPHCCRWGWQVIFCGEDCGFWRELGWCSVSPHITAARRCGTYIWMFLYIVCGTTGCTPSRPCHPVVSSPPPQHHHHRTLPISPRTWMHVLLVYHAARPDDQNTSRFRRVQMPYFTETLMYFTGTLMSPAKAVTAAIQPPSCAAEGCNWVIANGPAKICSRMGQSKCRRTSRVLVLRCSFLCAKWR